LSVVEVNEQHFNIGTIPMMVYNVMMDVSQAAEGTSFNLKEDVLARKFRSNILKQLFYILSDFLVMPSAEALEFEVEAPHKLHTYCQKILLF
jgi:hypothetical protein